MNAPLNRASIAASRHASGIGASTMETCVGEYAVGSRLPADQRSFLRPLQLAVVVPVLNEAENIKPLVEAVSNVLKDLRWEIIFVDDGSSDATIDRIDALALHHPHIRAVKRFGKTGLASAVMDGAMSSAAPVVAVMDGDLQHDERVLPAMYREMTCGAELVVASRYEEGGSAGGLSARRHQGSRVVTLLTNLLLRTGCSDPMSGFFMIDRARLAEMRPRLSTIGFKILLDILVTGRNSLRVVECPFHFRHRVSGESKMDAKVLVDLMLLLVDKTIGRIVPTRLILFLAVGSFGLLVHLTILRGALQAGSDFRAAQTIAVFMAIGCNFTLNNLITFASQRLRGWRAIVKGAVSYYLVCGTGALANIGVATLLFADQRNWWLAGAAGAVTGAVWNYAASSLLTWKLR